METFPVVDMEMLNTEQRVAIMEKLKDACENWGFLEVIFYCIFNLYTLIV